MLDGWYCRTLANEQSSANLDEQTDPNVDVNGDDSVSDDSFEQDGRRDAANNAIDYKSQYRYLKRKLKFLIYENEFFQDALRINQRRLLKVSRDRAFLLDRLLQYEKTENTSSESEETESSEDEAAKKRKIEQNNPNVTVQGATRGRKKKATTVAQPQTKPNLKNPSTEKFSTDNLNIENDHNKITTTEAEHQLQSRPPPVLQLNPERASETVPNEMFSNDPSLDSDSNDHINDGSSPTHVAAEECVPMEYTNN